VCMSLSPQVEAMVDTIRELGSRFEFQLKWPLFLKETSTDDAAAAAGGVGPCARVQLCICV
jgi:hypothetical protein